MKASVQVRKHTKRGNATLQALQKLSALSIYKWFLSHNMRFLQHRETHNIQLSSKAVCSYALWKVFIQRKKKSSLPEAAFPEGILFWSHFHMNKM